MKGLTRDGRGFISLFLVILLPLLMFLIAGTAQYTRFVAQSDVDLGQAVAEAARAAASCVVERSQAEGEPRIDPDKANLVFVSVLAKNLGLDPVTLSPLPGSGMAGTPGYVLVVYNGDDRYAPVGKKYVFNGAGLAVEDLAGEGFPRSFGVSKYDVLPGGAGARVTVLEAPGVVAVVTGRAKGVMGSDAETTRWAAARIVVRT
ncbi:hypothetical protein Desku_2441 [Desulfofundulus kuznetsovii DSM 6115]|uniref:Flp pilus-assembly TadG-like N-terminal domain-containing protein n=1 Tax=Desulfofundulus kuznetsovii (strain DSM 6115 / VKM B-1805 / 17) TaxID=760568 RepID=A0AAU8PPB2_DESK7|nr:hypothetical protein Desku_2441 [Desulfofundulus kuznetsovii DSM 6115]